MNPNDPVPARKTKILSSRHTSGSPGLSVALMTAPLWLTVLYLRFK